jgi:hypothetical protein
MAAPSRVRDYSELGETDTAARPVPSAWQPWPSTPAITGTTSDPALGTGATIQHEYNQVGKTVDFWVRFVFGTGFDPGSGFWQITLPVAPISSPRLIDAEAMAIDSSDTYKIHDVKPVIDPQLATSVSGDAARLFLFSPGGLLGDASAVASATAPFAWDDGDIVNITGRYEAA